LMFEIANVTGLYHVKWCSLDSHVFNLFIVFSSAFKLENDEGFVFMGR